MKINDYYVTTAPTDQNALDLFSGRWFSHVPGPGLSSGPAPLFDDPRVTWLADFRGRFDGQSVLELGPMEGGHTHILENAGASSIVSVEANTQSYLKCLVTKEVTGLKNARFLLGDLNVFLTENQERFDFILASGVLYHMIDPMLTLEHMTRATDEMLIWSHFFDDAAMPEGDPRRSEFTGETSVRRLGDHEMTYHHRAYSTSIGVDEFIGGIMSQSVWLEKKETIQFLERKGYSVTTAFENDGHQNGPSASIYAKR